MDVDISKLSGTEEEKLALQAKIYGDVTEAVVSSGNSTGITFWGYNDEDSWLLENNRGGKSPLIMNHDVPKPSYFAIAEALAK
jgi:GH35 family endo-1,4-beta-xylanase